MAEFHSSRRSGGRPDGAGTPDQADGLRRMFSGAGRRFLAVVANPLASFTGVALERLAAALALQGCSSLIVDAADTAPEPPESVALDLWSAIERLSPDVSYLAARDLPMRWVDTRGSAARFLEEVQAAAPERDVVLVHAQAADLVRLFSRQSIRPVFLAEDHPESVKECYAAMKWLALRCGWMSADLLLLASPTSPRVAQIAASLASCADRFADVALHDWAVIDPASLPQSLPEPDLSRLVAAQLRADETPVVSAAALPHAWQQPRARAAAHAGGH